MGVEAVGFSNAVARSLRSLAGKRRAPRAVPVVQLPYSSRFTPGFVTAPLAADPNVAPYFASTPFW